MAKVITDLSAAKAKTFFLRAESYSSLTLPSYFKFSPILKKVYFAQKNKKINSIKDGNKFKEIENPNIVIYINKDGKYAWRPHTLIHPVLYIDLVNQITQAENWAIIQNQFKKFSKYPQIECVSLPRVTARKVDSAQIVKETSSVPVKNELTKQDKPSSKNKNNAATQINNWWEHFEQRSIQLALEYNCFLQTDIADFYPSIYTHTIPWALHGRTDTKINRKDGIGNNIDNCIQNMQNRQTNGIPQGSVVMDFIAEMVSGYADRCLAIKLKRLKITEYQILRYRDDYRIFTNNINLAQAIAKELTVILLKLNLKLNASKTKISQNIIVDSVKEEKRYWLDRTAKPKYLPKRLLQIMSYADTYPNAGYLSKVLTDFYDKLLKKSNHNTVNHDSENLSMISMAVNLLVKNPRAIPVTVSIISVLLNHLSQIKLRDKCINQIKDKISTIVHTDFLELWLQRLTLPIERNKEQNHNTIKGLTNSPDFEYSLYKHPLSQSMIKQESPWDYSWISCTSIKTALSNGKIFDQTQIDNLGDVIARREFEIFTKHSF